MNFYLLDAAGAGLFLGLLVIFMIVAIILEAVTMIILKYNSAGKSFLDAFLVNLASLIVGVLIANFNSEGLDFTGNPWIDVSLLFLTTVVVEFIFLYLLNRKKPIQKTLVAEVVINVVSYLAFVLLKFAFTGF